jgi:hypothetical protein
MSYNVIVFCQARYQRNRIQIKIPAGFRKNVPGYFLNRYMTHMREFEDTKYRGSKKDIQYNRQKDNQ